MSRDDDDETWRFGEVRRDEDGIPIAVPRRTNPHGIPVVLVDRPLKSKKHRHTTTSEEIAVIRDGERDLDERVSALEQADDTGEKQSPIDIAVDKAVARRIRKLKKWIAGAVVAALGSLGAGAKSALDSREEAGAEKAERRHLKEEFERLRSLWFRSSLSRWDRDDDYPSPPPPRPDPKGNVP